MKNNLCSWRGPLGVSTNTTLKTNTQTLINKLLHPSSGLHMTESVRSAIKMVSCCVTLIPVCFDDFFTMPKLEIGRLETLSTILKSHTITHQQIFVSVHWTKHIKWYTTGWQVSHDRTLSIQYVSSNFIDEKTKTERKSPFQVFSRRYAMIIVGCFLFTLIRACALSECY